MKPHEQFCPNPACRARGEVGKGNIVIHSQKRRRYKCQQCRHTFSERQGTALFGIKKPEGLFSVVVTLLVNGCPVQAIVAAFGLDESRVRFIGRGVSSTSIISALTSASPCEMPSQ